MRQLSPGAKDALINFVAAYAESMTSTMIDQKAEVAKQKAIVCLRDTDIDGQVFVAAVSMMHSESGKAMLFQMFHRLLTPREAAIAIVAIAIDKEGRP